MSNPYSTAIQCSLTTRNCDVLVNNSEETSKKDSATLSSSSPSSNKLINNLILKQLNQLHLALNHTRIFIANYIDTQINAIDYDAEYLLESLAIHDTDAYDLSLNKHLTQSSHEDRQTCSRSSINATRNEMIHALKKLERQLLDEFEARGILDDDQENFLYFKFDLNQKIDLFYREHHRLTFISNDESASYQPDDIFVLKEKIEHEFFHLSRRIFRFKTITYLSSVNPNDTFSTKSIVSLEKSKVDSMGYLLIIDDLYLNSHEIELIKIFLSEIKQQNWLEASFSQFESNFSLLKLIQQFSQLKFNSGASVGNYELELTDNIIILFEILKQFFEDLSSSDKKFIYHYNTNSFIEAFKGIEEIDMSYCQISSISTDFIKFFQSLRHIRLASNQLEDINKFLKNLKHSSQLEELILKKNKLSTFDFEGEYDFQLANMKELNLNENFLETLTSKQFSPLVNLERLDLGSNKLSKIDKDAFFGLNKLKILHLEKNVIEEIDDDHIFANLKHLNELHLAKNQISKLSPKVFHGLPELKFLNLRENQLLLLHDDQFRELSDLRELIIYKNHIRKIELNAFRGLRSLIKLDLNSNELEVLSQPIFDPLVNLRELGLNDNRMRQISQEIFDQLFNLTKLDLQLNQLKVIHENQFRNLSCLVELNISFNYIRYVYKDSFKGLNSLKRLNLRRNNLALTNNQFKLLASLEELDLSLNAIESLHLNSFDGLKNLKILHLSENNLRSLDDNQFFQLKNLEILNLYKNSMRVIHVESFNGLNKLKRLNLRSMNLENDEPVIINEEDFEKLPALSDLRL